MRFCPLLLSDNPIKSQASAIADRIQHIGCKILGNGITDNRLDVSTQIPAGLTEMPAKVYSPRESFPGKCLLKTASIFFTRSQTSPG